MANNRPTHRRNLAAPPPEPKPSSMEPTVKKQTKPSTSHHLSYNLDPTIPSKPSSRVNASLRAHHTTQAKAMSASAILDDDGSSKFSAKPTKELVCKDKLSKPSRDLVEKKRVEEVAVVKKKKEAQKEREFDGRRLSVSMAARGGDGGGRRRSSVSGSSQVQLADVFASNGVKIVSVDMPPFMQIHAVECARKTHDSLEKFTSKTLALTLKKEFDGVYGPAWHCIVGTSFGSFVTHSVSGFLYFSMDQKLYILLFKTTVQRAE